MIPAEFDYAAPDTLDEAIKALVDGGEDAKLLAGGHSLIPLMKLRLAAPTLLVDLRKVPGLRGVQRENGTWRIGALTPHAELEHTAELGVVARGGRDDRRPAGPQPRHDRRLAGPRRPRLRPAGGAADLRGRRSRCKAAGGPADVGADDLFQNYLETAIGRAEVLTEVRMPAFDGWGYGYQKFNRRSEDWAMVAVSALVKQTGDVCEDVRIGLTNMGSVPLRADAVEEALRGQALTAESIAQAAEQAAEGTDPPADLNATADYKRHLARVLCRRALDEAAGLP